LAELLRDRGLLSSKAASPQVWIAAEADNRQRDVRRAATALRRNGVSVEYALRDQAIMKQVKAARSAGAEYVLTLHDASGKAEPHSWSPKDVPPDWDRTIDALGL